MTRDCDSGEARDLLPEFLHQRLDPATRERVAAHVALCGPCASELQFLRMAAQSLVAPSVDTAAIVRAVTSRPRVTAGGGAHDANTFDANARGASSGVRALPVGRRSLVPWRIAAGFSLFVAGGLGLALLQRQRPTLEATATLADASRSVIPVVKSARESLASARESLASSRPVAGTRGPEGKASATPVGVGGGLADLSDTDLQQLLETIDGASAVPTVEPESRSAPLMSSAGRPGRPGGMQ